MTLKEAIREVESAPDMKVGNVPENDEYRFFMPDFGEPVLMNAVPYCRKATDETGWTYLFGGEPDLLEGARSVGLPE